MRAFIAIQVRVRSTNQGQQQRQLHEEHATKLRTHRVDDDVPPVKQLRCAGGRLPATTTIVPRFDYPSF